MKKRAEQKRAFDLFVSSERIPFFFLSLSLWKTIRMNFKLQAKKTPFQRHKEEQELKRKVTWRESEKEKDYSSFSVSSRKKTTSTSSSLFFPLHTHKKTLTA